MDSAGLVVAGKELKNPEILSFLWLQQSHNRHQDADTILDDEGVLGGLTFFIMQIRGLDH